MHGVEAVWISCRPASKRDEKPDRRAPVAREGTAVGEMANCLDALGGISLSNLRNNREESAIISETGRTPRHTNEQVKGCGIERLQGAVELQRRAAFLAVHVGIGDFRASSIIVGISSMVECRICHQRHGEWLEAVALCSMSRRWTMDVMSGTALAVAKTRSFPSANNHRSISSRVQLPRALSYPTGLAEHPSCDSRLCPGSAFSGSAIFFSAAYVAA